MGSRFALQKLPNVFRKLKSAAGKTLHILTSFAQSGEKIVRQPRYSRYVSLIFTHVRQLQTGM